MCCVSIEVQYTCILISPTKKSGYDPFVNLMTCAAVLLYLKAHMPGIQSFMNTTWRVDNLISGDALIVSCHIVMDHSYSSKIEDRGVLGSIYRLPTAAQPGLSGITAKPGDTGFGDAIYITG